MKLELNKPAPDSDKLILHMAKTLQIADSLINYRFCGSNFWTSLPQHVENPVLWTKFLAFPGIWIL